MRRAAAAALALGLAVLGPAPARAGDAAAAPLEAAARHGVLVHLRFQKDLAADATGVAAPDADAATEVYRRWRMSQRVPGFVVRDRRTVVVADVFVAPGAVRGIDVETLDGSRAAGRLVAFLPAHGAAVITTDVDLPATPLTAPPPPPPDGAAAPAHDPTTLWSAALAEGGDGLVATAEPLRDASARLRDPKGAVAAGRPRRPAAGLAGTAVARTAELLVGDDGTVAGVRFDSDPLAPGGPWTLPSVLAGLADARPLDALATGAAGAAARARVHGVRLGFRPGTADDEGAGVASFLSSPPPPEPDPDARYWGLAVSADALVVPAALPPSWVTRLVKVTVDRGDGTPVEGRYEGRVPNFGAFVVRVPGGGLDPLPDVRPAPPPPRHAVLVHRTAWRAGARRDGLAYDRSLGAPRGYGDRRFLATEGAVEAGAFLLDLDGRVLGFAAELQPDDVERVAPRGGVDDGRRGVVAALFADLGAPASLTEGLDRRVLPAASRAARRLPWLGVELEPIRSGAVAEALDIAGPTRDGTRGLLVNHVYAGSPADRAGLKVDDVLLSARRTSGPGADAPPRRSTGGPNASDWPEASDATRPWTPRLNPLVRLLEAWGEGTTYVLEVLRDDAVVEVGTAVETGPADVGTAEEAYDAESGLAVKELTYEVRHALRLAADAPGVLVSSVDDGSTAQQARILPFEVLLEIDGKPLDGPRGFARAIVEARMSGRREARLVLLRLDRTRFVDLRIATGPSAAGTPGK